MRFISVLLAWMLLCSSQSIAEDRIPSDTLWRVISQRIILPEAAHTLQKKLQSLGFHPLLFVQHEAIELHVFDDPTTYNSRTAAEHARIHWQQLGIDADIYPLTNPPHQFSIGLGRYYLDEYALMLQQKLETSGHSFTYRRMKKVIPVYRLTFSPVGQHNATHLWQALHRTGLGSPVLMPETEFRRLYPQYQPLESVPTQPPIRSEKRSNK